MAKPNVSNLRAVIADDRKDVRAWLAAELRGLGVLRVETLGSAAGLRLLAVTPEPDAVPAQEAPAGRGEPALAEAVTRFSHDVASPLMCVLALSSLLAGDGEQTDRTREDLERIQAAAEEIAALVRALREQFPSAARTGQPPSS